MYELTNEDVEAITDELHRRYGSVFSKRRIVKEVSRAREVLEPVSRHPEFLSILIEKRARTALHKRALKRGEELHHIPEILFVCVHNEGRSPMAGAFAEHIGGDRVFVRTAGSDPTGQLNPVVVKVMRERGIPIHDYPTAVTDDLLHLPDVVVHLGKHLPDLPGTRQLLWPVRDPQGEPIDVVRGIADEIEEKVRDLLESMGAVADDDEDEPAPPPRATQPAVDPTGDRADGATTDGATTDGATA